MNEQLTHYTYQKEQKLFSCVFVLDNVEDPYNISSIFRLADALGIEKIYLTGKTNILEKEKVKRVSRSALNYVNYEYYEDIFKVIDKLKKERYQINALEITTQSISLDKITWNKNDKVVFIVGNENRGVSFNVLQIVDRTIHIDMYGRNSSMNVAMSLGLASYQFIKQIKL